MKTPIGHDVFERCTSLESVIIPNSVTEMGESVFYVCTSLESVTIPDSVERICNDAFWRCTALKKLNISKIEGREIGCNAFDNTAIDEATRAIVYSEQNVF